jgi:uncharacterized protein DUF4160
MFFDDHDPPHFHARHASGQARIRIDTLEMMDSTLAGASSVWFSPGPRSTNELIENWATSACR